LFLDAVVKQGIISKKLAVAALAVDFINPVFKGAMQFVEVRSGSR